jgi:hypothetical protein
VHDEQGEQDRRRGQHQKAAEQGKREDEGGVPIPEGGGEALGRTTGACGEHRNPLVVASPIRRRY